MAKKYLPKLHLSAHRFVGGALVGVILLSVIVVPFVRADEFDAKINRLNQKNQNTQENVDQLGAQAASYQDTINKLQQQIDGVQAQIDANKVRVVKLHKQIRQAEIELAKQKRILGDSIRAMYIEGQISTLEMLASSKNLSDFIDKQEYRTTVQNKIKDTLDQIIELKHKLKAQQDSLEQTIKEQQDLQNRLDSQRAHKSLLLSLNEDQQGVLNNRIHENNARIASLRAQQAAANRQLGGNLIAGDPGHGGYPAIWDQSAQDSLVDTWGMYNRECVSYTAWKVYQTFGHMPYWGGRGNANQWPGDAQSEGIATGTTPRAHSVAIWMVGAYGHAMWVEDAYSNGYIHVSQYNYDYQGHYSEMTINGAGLTYIYFQ